MYYKIVILATLLIFVSLFNSNISANPTQRISLENPKLSWLFSTSFQNVHDNIISFKDIYQEQSTISQLVFNIGIRYPINNQWSITTKLPISYTKTQITGERYTNEFVPFKKTETTATIHKPSYTISYQHKLTANNRLSTSATYNSHAKKINHTTIIERLYDPLILSAGFQINQLNKKLSLQGLCSLTLAANERWAYGTTVQANFQQASLQHRVFYSHKQTNIEFSITPSLNTNNWSLNLNLSSGF